MEDKDLQTQNALFRCHILSVHLSRGLTINRELHHQACVLCNPFSLHLTYHSSTWDTRLMLGAQHQKGHLAIRPLRPLLPASGSQPRPLPVPSLPLQPPLLLLLRLHVQRLVPPLLPFGDVEVEHPLAVAPVQPEHNGEQEDEEEDEQEGKDQPILDGCLERRNANLLLIPGKQSVICSQVLRLSLTWCKAWLMH